MKSVIPPSKTSKFYAIFKATLQKALDDRPKIPKGIRKNGIEKHILCHVVEPTQKRPDNPNGKWAIDSDGRRHNLFKQTYIPIKDVDRQQFLECSFEVSK